MTAHRRLVVAGIVLLALAGAVHVTLRATYGERLAYVHVRWAPSVDPATQEQVERAHGLRRVEFRERRTWGYYLTDTSTENIRDLVRHPAVDDTHHIDRTDFDVASTAPRGEYLTDRPAWIARSLEFFRRAFLLLGAVALVVGAYRLWRDRTATPSPAP
ncbi:MAG: hypothetical protein HYY76_14085 [Acidobacteria bacterium]|nr:hypothetical protein [Acidobacteriota bacterium]